MNLCFIGNDLDLVKRFAAVDGFTVSNTFNTLDSLLEVSIKADILIVSDRVAGLNQFITYADDSFKGSFEYIFYLVSSENMRFNTKNILNQHGILMIPPKYTEQKIVDFVCSQVFTNYHIDNNIVVFFGADTKVGTTMISQTVAEILAKKTGNKIFLGFMDGMPGTDYFKGSFQSSIDEIKLKLLNGVLNISDIQIECKVFDNLFVLQGVKNFLYRREYEMTDVECFLNILSENFDAVVLDAGCNIELALCLGSLVSTKNRYLITTPQKKSLVSFKSINEILDKLLLDSFSLIINKYSPDFDKPHEIASKYNNYTLVGWLPFLENGWQAEAENTLLYNYGDKKYCLKMELLSNIIANSLGIIESQVAQKKKFKLFG